MQAAGLDRSLLDVIQSSLRHRAALCELVLAVYRVELTSTLRRMAGSGVEEGDVDHVHALAESIAVAATAAAMPLVEEGALRLKRRAIAAHGGGKREEGAMFAAGLEVIDRILDTAKAALAKRPQRSDALN